MKRRFFGNMMKIEKKNFGLGFSQKETVNFSLTGS